MPSANWVLAQKGDIQFLSHAPLASLSRRFECQSVSYVLSSYLFIINYRHGELMFDADIELN